MTTPSISRNAIDECLWQIRLRLYQSGAGWDESGSEIAPLEWYVNTGRASVEFLRALVTAKPFMVARRLHKGGSYDEAVSRIKDYLKVSA